MNLSALQKFIIKQCARAKDKRVARSVLDQFYGQKKNPPKDAVNIITKSLERLIKKDLIVAYGYKTSQKFFIQNIRLTPAGSKLAKKLFGFQQRLPFKMKS